MISLAWVSADRRIASLVAVASGILALPFLASISMLDEGALVHIADRIASGEVLYRDVVTGVMPAAYYLHALLFLVFGRSLLVGRLFMILLFALASAGVFLTARSVTSRAVALSAALSFSALSVSQWRFPGYASQAIFLVFLTLAAARVFLETRRQKWLFLTGLGLGFTILFKQNYGAFASLGVAVGLLAGAPDARRGFRDVATAAVVAAMPIAVTAALFASAVLPRISGISPCASPSRSRSRFSPVPGRRSGESPMAGSCGISSTTFPSRSWHWT